MLMKKPAVVWPAGEFESVTLISGCAPVVTVVGVPVIWPVTAFKDNPLGKEFTTTDHENGAGPPAAASVAEYGVPTWPSGRDVVVIVSVAAMVLSVSAADATCIGELESVT